MIEINVDLTEAKRLFAQLRAKAINTRPAMIDISNVLAASVQENFRVGGRPKWQPLSKARINQRSKPHYSSDGQEKKVTWPGGILVDFGVLKNSVSPHANNDSAVASTTNDNAEALDKGNPAWNLPARPFMVLRQEDVKDAEAILLRHLLK